jgi:voltage-gated potassium channel
MTDASNSSRNQARPTSGAYQVFMMVLCVFALAVLGYDAIGKPDAHTREILVFTDTALCIAFLIDFLVSFFKAPNRWRYFYTWGWMDLASSIPSGALPIRMLRLGRVARIVRVLRILRGVRATRTVTSFILTKRAQSTFLAAALLSILFVFLGSIAILQIEKVPGANISTPTDALWWAFETVTSVDYGDRYPVTGEGRLVAGLLVVVGAALFGTLAGSAAMWFLAPSQQKEQEDIAELRVDIAELKELLKARKEG